MARPRLCAESLGADWAENGFVDTGRPCATIIRPPERGVQEVCNSTTGELSSERIRLFVFRPEGLWCESEAFCCRRAAWSLKTQQRETSRPLAGFGLREEMNPSTLCSTGRSAVSPLGALASRHGKTIEHQARTEELSSPLREGARSLHGEFDPGSGRTLAARLTHASRARTGASAPGTAANG